MSTSTHSSTKPSRIGKLHFGPCNALEILCSKNPNIISRFDLLWKAIYTSSSFSFSLSVAHNTKTTVRCVRQLQ